MPKTKKQALEEKAKDLKQRLQASALSARAPKTNYLFALSAKMLGTNANQHA